MELNGFVVLFIVTILIFYAFYRRRLKHMHDLTDHMPGIKSLPWKAMISHLFNKDKSRVYSELNVAIFFNLRTILDLN